MAMANAPFPSSLPLTDITTTFQNNPKEQVWSGPFTFVLAADTQFGMIDSYVYKKTEPGWTKEIELTQIAINILNTMKPKPRFLVVCGDLLDSFPFAGHLLEIRERQYADFVKVFKNLDPEIKLICVCGNHDVGDDPTEETVAIYRKQFGPDYYSFWVAGVKFIVLNSQYFKSPACVPEETANQLKFMDTISDSNAKHIVVFQHIPFFLQNAEEENDYFNIDKAARLDFLDRLKNSGVRYIFCGHYHRNAGGHYNGIEQVVTSAVSAQLGNDKSGIRIVNVFEDKITHKYINLEENNGGDDNEVGNDRKNSLHEDRKEKKDSCCCAVM